MQPSFSLALGAFAVRYGKGSHPGASAFSPGVQGPPFTLFLPPTPSQLCIDYVPVLLWQPLANDDQNWSVFLNRMMIQCLTAYVAGYLVSLFGTCSTTNPSAHDYFFFSTLASDGHPIKARRGQGVACKASFATCRASSCGAPHGAPRLTTTSEIPRAFCQRTSSSCCRRIW